jgi:hypothetical protein
MAVQPTMAARCENKRVRRASVRAIVNDRPAMARYTNGSCDAGKCDRNKASRAVSSSE